MKKNLMSVFLGIVFLLNLSASAASLPVPKNVAFKNATSTYVAGSVEKISIETSLKDLGVSSILYDIGVSREVKQGGFVFYDQLTKHIIVPDGAKDVLDFDLSIPQVGTTTKDTYVVYVRSYSFENPNVEKMIIIGTPFSIVNGVYKDHIEIRNVDVAYGKKKISLLADQPSIRLSQVKSSLDEGATFDLHIDSSFDTVITPSILYKNIFSDSKKDATLDFLPIKKGKHVYTIKTNLFKDPGSYSGQIQLADSASKMLGSFGFSYTLQLDGKKIGFVNTSISSTGKQYDLQYEVFPYLIDISEKQQIRKVSFDFFDASGVSIFSTSTQVDLLQRLNTFKYIPKEVYKAVKVKITVFDTNGKGIEEERDIHFDRIFNMNIPIYGLMLLVLFVLIFLYKKYKNKKYVFVGLFLLVISFLLYTFVPVKGDYELPAVNITYRTFSDRPDRLETYLFLPILNKNFATETANCEPGTQDQALFKNDVVFPALPGNTETNLESLDDRGWSNNGSYPKGQLWLGVSSVDINTAKNNRVIAAPHTPNHCGGNSNCYSSARVVCLDCYTGLQTWSQSAVGSRFTYGWFKIADLPRPVPQDAKRYVYAAMYDNSYYAGSNSGTVFLPINWTTELGRSYAGSSYKVGFPVARMTIPLNPTCTQQPPSDYCSNISGSQATPLFQAHGRNYFLSLDPSGGLYFTSSDVLSAQVCAIDMCANTSDVEEERPDGYIWNPAGITPYEQYSCVQDTPEICSCAGGRTYTCEDNGIQTSSTPNAPQCSLTASCSYAQPTGNQVTFNYTATNIIGSLTNANSETHSIPATGNGTIVSAGGGRVLGNTGDAQTSNASCSYSYTNTACTDINNPACNCQPGDTDCDGDIDINDDPDSINPQILSFKTTPYVKQGQQCVFTWQTIDMASCNMGSPSGSASFNTDAGKNITQTLTCLSNEQTPRPFKATKTCSVEPVIKQK